MPLFAAPAFRPLLKQEARLIDVHLSRQRGRVGVTLEAAGLPTGTHFSNADLRLTVDTDGQISGSLRGRAEALPIADRSVDTVVIRHVVECLQQPQVLVREALRVLAGQGVLLVTGIHPLSLWSPWMWQQARACGVHFQPVSTARWRQWLDAAAVSVSRIDRFGPVSPWMGGGLESVIGGGFILLAHKRRMPMTGIPLTTRMRRVPTASSTACVSRRRCA